ncbi:phosphatase PAP2 family protein [Streptomyces thermoviolaceus]|uniref:Phosphatase PAP2 family protein n=1 Tax=Streptomyces thermoviolaceus subsp. thermoviolaceus TaxID=66860 RepID=A0ABX0YPR6_STRTL|nr:MULTISPECIES: phosphatase PAP2 family protein [Streptomyces]MCM3262662.1 phosphatase PAP2 family protein [Streptomyces thermoviolaceus]NJP13919.1 phosphatase PAP2 family protein [Streptomyces thermoviolaceus subsp. thermoviolaceus]RSS06622.1 phosphatase PAP2 family protein [Streptomyces sp. WAC00469]WTD50281.1 phosphatase PAP2 family protein [Streptomyces thermoviolaceus]GGV64074.1 phosphatase PAP2 family protein [Streptomyces thermoviolaceus subsp. apingens]
MRSASVTSAPAPTGPRGPRSPVCRALCVLAGCSAVLSALVAARWTPLMRWDETVARIVHHWAVAEHGTTRVARFLTDWVWDPLTLRLLCVAVALVLAVRRPTRFDALWLVAAGALGLLLQYAVKAAVGRPRPVWPDPVDTARQAAFPSGHAMTAAVVCGLLLWLLHRHRAGRALWPAAVVLAAVSVVGVGLTRVWLGVHWLSDVVGGWLLGATVVAAAAAVHDPARKRWPAHVP